MISRNHLQIIREVRRCGTLSSAAEELCLTQSALSHSIGKLEAVLGTPVWHREGRRLRLTRAGQALLALADRVLPEFVHCEKQIVETAAGERGLLRVGMECHPCYRWLQNIVIPFLDEWRHVDLDIMQQFQFDGLTALCSYDLDMLVTPDPEQRPRINFIPAFDYELVLVLPGDHPAAGRTHVRPADLKHETLFTYPVPPERLDVFQYFLNPAGVKPAAHKSIESTELMLQMVVAGRGVTALPGWLVEQYASNRPLVTRSLGRKGVFKKIWLGIHEDNMDVPYIRRFVDIARTKSPTLTGGAPKPPHHRNATDS